MKFPFFSRLKKELKGAGEKRGGVIALYALLLLPFPFLFSYLSGKKESLNEIEKTIDLWEIRLEKIKGLQKGRSEFIAAFSEADPYYIDHEIESLKFLQREVEALSLVNSHPAFATYTLMKTRLSDLTSGKNSLIFNEHNRKAKHYIEEVELQQSRPIEVDKEDLQMVLSRIEGVSIGRNEILKQRPQLIIRNFHLRKKDLAERETYLIEMQLIKRAYLK